ncbi:branched-chain amino acid ABC-type transport system, permease component [Herbaspirillum sp. CF444]|uniref:branched-chain amino acid ABC transporter permease n=1 Tax=Herbaspirillum sp. CF444 TaxID=1144319 RepID=UPI00027278CC|nr:branched-chain amino acid ABC transporter permease [Herbaspirillum sp. CF444]EJL92278.1 branched-chain amino acid ABC-type transport system, permease component [Herbaspirillum sp. CF444]
MDSSIAAILLLDGLTNGIVYGLIAIALVLVFAVTRILFIPQGEFVAFGALTLAMLQQGMVPGPVWLLLLLAVCATGMQVAALLRSGQRAGIVRCIVKNLFLPVLISALVAWAAPQQFALPVQVALTLLLITALGPLMYQVVYESLADASVLVLLIVSVGIHLAMTGLGLVFFGAEGFRTPAFWDSRWSFGAVTLSAQTVVVVLAALALLVALWLFSDRTLYGKALRATAVNRLGARLMGISTTLAGKLSFGVAAFIGALSGVLIGPMSTIFYDSGFLIGLKGFVAATIGGLASFPLAACGALFVGLLESFSSFWASDYKEVIVFMSLLPVLLWRSFVAPAHDEDEE